jgi:hypothetical protein
MLARAPRDVAHADVAQVKRSRPQRCLPRPAWGNGAVCPATPGANARRPGERADQRRWMTASAPWTAFPSSDDVRPDVNRGAVTRRAAVAGQRGAACRCRDRPRTPSAACASPPGAWRSHPRTTSQLLGHGGDLLLPGTCLGHGNLLVNVRAPALSLIPQRHRHQRGPGLLASAAGPPMILAGSPKNSTSIPLPVRSRSHSRATRPPARSRCARTPNLLAPAEAAAPPCPASPGTPRTGHTAIPGAVAPPLW